MQEPLGQVVVSQENDAVALALVPASVPFRYHSTFVTPTLSVALTFTETTPDTVVPDAGEVIAAVGGVVSGAVFCTDTLSGAEVPTFPAVSYAFACSV